MPIDPSIPLQVRPIQIDSPMEMAGNFLKLKELREVSMQRMRDRQEDEQIRSILQESGGDMEAALPRIRQVSVPKSLAIEDTWAKSKKATAELGNLQLTGEKLRLETSEKAMDFVAQELGTVTDQQSYDHWRAYSSAVRHSVGLPEAQLSPTYSPETIRQYQMSGLAFKDQLAAEKQKLQAKEFSLGGKTVAGSYNPATGQYLHQGKDVSADAGAVQAAERSSTPESQAIAAAEREKGAPLTSAELTALHGRWGKSDDRPRISVSVAGGGGGLTPGPGGGLEYAGTMARLLGRVPVGMARSGDARAIINEAARQSKMLGQTPVAAMQRAAMFSSDSKSMGQLTKMRDAASAYENKAQSQLDLVDQLSDKVNRTSIPLLNKAILAGKTEIAGDADATLLLNAILTASTEYAKIMAGGTASAAAVTDSAQKEAQKLLNASMSPDTLRKATALMRQEMGYTMQGYDAALGHIGERMTGGAPVSSEQPAPEAGKKKDPMGIR